VTGSFGVAALGQHGDSGEALVRAADHAMYEAKAGGRNRVAVAAPRSLAPA
jgi:diguanylate cyclase (GGDEF)-like protein